MERRMTDKTRRDFLAHAAKTVALGAGLAVAAPVALAQGGKALTDAELANLKRLHEAPTLSVEDLHDVLNMQTVHLRPGRTLENALLAAKPMMAHGPVTILVHEGVYGQDLVIGEGYDGLTIQGAPTIDQWSLEHAFLIDRPVDVRSDVTLHGLTFQTTLDFEGFDLIEDDFKGQCHDCTFHGGAPSRGWITAAPDFPVSSFRDIPCRELPRASKNLWWTPKAGLEPQMLGGRTELFGQSTVQVMSKATGKPLGLVQAIDLDNRVAYRLPLLLVDGVQRWQRDLPLVAEKISDILYHTGRPHHG